MRVKRRTYLQTHWHPPLLVDTSGKSGASLLSFKVFLSYRSSVRHIPWLCRLESACLCQTVCAWDLVCVIWGGSWGSRAVAVSLWTLPAASRAACSVEYEMAIFTQCWHGGAVTVLGPGFKLLLINTARFSLAEVNPA